MSAPRRIQLRRTAGWRKPEGAVSVARPSKWGNPFRLDSECPWQVTDQHGNAWSIGAGNDWRELAVDLFRTYTHPASTSGFDYPLYAEIEAELAGKDLACWCPLDQPCHADVLLEIANGRQAEGDEAGAIAGVGHRK